MNPNRETFWTLPLAICLELDADQQDFIRDQIYEFERRTKRTARAKMTLTGETQSVSTLPRETPEDGGYIKPSSVAASAAPVSTQFRPVSQFPPELSAASTTATTAATKDMSTVDPSKDKDKVYMSMNGAKSK